MVNDLDRYTHPVWVAPPLQVLEGVVEVPALVPDVEVLVPAPDAEVPVLALVEANGIILAKGANINVIVIDDTKNAEEGWEGMVVVNVCIQNFIY